MPDPDGRDTVNFGLYSGLILILAGFQSDNFTIRPSHLSGDVTQVGFLFGQNLVIGLILKSTGVWKPKSARLATDAACQSISILAVFSTDQTVLRPRNQWPQVDDVGVTVLHWPTLKVTP